MEITRSVFYFIVAGLCELGGAYLIWLWLREDKGLWVALLGAIILVAYGYMHTLQPAHYGRIQAAYSGFFIALALLWGWQFDKVVPDRYDLIGAGIALVGVAIIMYWPRG